MVHEGRKAGGTARAETDWRPAVAPTLALIAIGIVPGLLKGLYEPYTGTLMAAYVTFGLLFISLVLGGLTFMVFRDLSSRRMKVFRLAPDEVVVGEADGAVRVKSSDDRW